MKKISFIAMSVTLAMNFPAFAEETSTETTTSTVKKSDLVTSDKDAKKDIDDEITNAKLRAELGSKKKLSMASTLSYSGAAITNPLSTERPQLNDGQAYADPTKASATVALKYRLTENNSLNFGFGIQSTPEYVKNKATGEKQAAETTASSPYVTFNRAVRIGGVQNIFSTSLTKYTASEDVNDSKLNFSGYLSHTMMSSIGTTKAEIALYSFVSQEFYADGAADSGTLRMAGIYPIFEYAFTEKLSFRTVSRWLTFVVDKSNPEKATLAGQTQSVGLGYAITRDLYVYPNMQWRWGKMAADQTTVGFSANINL